MFLLVLNFVLYNEIISNLLNITIHDNEINLLIGETRAIVPFKLDLTICCTYSDDPESPIASFNSKETKTINCVGMNNQCDVITENIEEPSTHLTIKNFTLYYNNDDSSIIIGDTYLALGFQIEKNSSIVYLAYNNGIINNLCFSIIINNKFDGNLYLGGIPNKYKHYQKGYCKVVSNHRTWGCNLTAISFLTYEYTNSTYVYFDFEWRQKILLPKEFIDYFYIVTRNIKSESAYDRIKYYPMKFHFGNFAFKIDDLIYRKQNGEYIVQCWESLFNILTTPFFLKYILLFDYENSIITIYGESGIEERVYTNKIKSEDLLKFNCFILSISLVYLVFIIKFKIK